MGGVKEKTAAVAYLFFFLHKLCGTNLLRREGWGGGGGGLRRTKEKTEQQWPTSSSFCISSRSLSG